LATWHVQIPGKIITELSMRRSDDQEIEEDLEGARVPPRWVGLMLMYRRQTSVSTQLGASSKLSGYRCLPTIVFSGNVTYRHGKNTPLCARHWVSLI